MARYVTTKSASGSSSGGGAGVTLDQVCTAVCNVVCCLTTQQAGLTTSISPGYGEWEMICNCPNWTDCYGCNVIWCIDTSKYKAFKIKYNGIANCACCYTYMCLGFGPPKSINDCFCSCSNAYYAYCTCAWPVKSCCCWQAYACCAMLNGACVYCCNGVTSQSWGFEWIVCAPPWKKCTNDGQGGGVYFDFYYKKFIAECGEYYFPNWDRQKGFNFCSCLHWSKQQNTDCYLERLCMKFSDSPMQPTVGTDTFLTWCANQGGMCYTGIPCWTIWGVPCYRPKFGTCSMTTS